MPVVDRQKEREIVKRATERGMNQDQIKAAVLQFRSQGLGGEAKPDKQATPLERARLSFGDAQGREKFIEERGITQVNKPGFDLGDITSKAGGLLPLLLGTAGAGVGGIAGAPTGPGALATASVGGAAGGVAGEQIRQSIGGLLGVQGPQGAEQRKELVSEGALGGLAPGVGKAASIAGKAILGGTAKKLIQKGLRIPATVLDKFDRQGVDFVDEVVKLNPIGSKSQVKNQMLKINKQAKGAVDELVENSNEKFTSDEIIGKVIDATAESVSKAEGTGNIAKAKQIEEITIKVLEKNLGKNKEISIQAVQTLKKDLQEELGAAGLSEAGIKTAQRDIEKIVKELVESRIPEVAGLNRRTQISRALINSLNKLDNRTAVGLIDAVRSSTPNFLAGSLGGVAGFATGGPVGSAIGSALGFSGVSTARSIASSTASRTGRAQLLKLLEKAPPGSANVLGQILQRMVQQ